jgi:hypothetical protein
MPLQPVVRPRIANSRRVNLPLLVALFVGFQTGAMFMMLMQRGDHTCKVTPAEPPPPSYLIGGPWFPPGAPLHFAEPPPPDAAPAVRISSEVVAPGSYFTVTVSAPPNLPRNAWVGVIPSHITHGDEAMNDQHDVSYQYMEGRTHAVLTFQAPEVPGSYELRLHDTDANGVELATSAAFTVRGHSPG